MDKDNKLTLKQAYKFFREGTTTNNLSTATILAYNSDLKQLLGFLQDEGLTEIAEVMPLHLHKFQEKMGRKGYLGVSLARKLNAFRRFFKFLHEKKLLENNPTLNLSSPKLSRSAPRILTRMEYRALRDSCRNDSRTAALTEIFLQTGMKVNEVANLKLSDFKKDSLRLRKNDPSQSREIPLTSSLRQALDRYLKSRLKTDCQHLFITKNGTPLLVRNLTTIMMRCFKEAEIKNASLNALRHTWICQQLSYGVPLETISYLVGHKRISTTASYLSLIPKRPSRIKNKMKDL